MQQFLARHIAGKTFCKPQATYVIDNGRVEGVHAVTIWYHPVKPQTPLEFAWARTSRVTESLYPLDAAGKRSGPPQVRQLANIVGWCTVCSSCASRHFYPPPPNY